MEWLSLGYGGAYGPLYRSDACVGRREEAGLGKEKPWAVLSSESISTVYQIFQAKSSHVLQELACTVPQDMVFVLATCGTTEDNHIQRNYLSYWPLLLCKARNLWKRSIFIATKTRCQNLLRNKGALFSMFLLCFRLCIVLPFPSWLMTCTPPFLNWELRDLGSAAQEVTDSPLSPVLRSMWEEGNWPCLGHVHPQDDMLCLRG